MYPQAKEAVLISRNNVLDYRVLKKLNVRIQQFMNREFGCDHFDDIDNGYFTQKFDLAHFRVHFYRSTEYCGENFQRNNNKKLDRI